jgi:glutamate dehydrogenase (NAD(P)+)
MESQKTLKAVPANQKRREKLRWVDETAPVSAHTKENTLESYLVTEWFDQQSGARGFLVIDELIEGLSGGGIRMQKGVTKEEVQRLARTMTLKLVGLDMPIGGAKAGIDYPPLAGDATDVLQRFLEAHKPLMMHYWGASEDMGTSKADIARIARDMGMKTQVDAFLENRDDRAQATSDLAAALDLSVDGKPITHVITGAGVAGSVLASLDWLGIEAPKARAAIQGFGSVGASTAHYLYEAGVNVVAVSDVMGLIVCESGLDIPALLELKDDKGNIDRTGLPEAHRAVSGENWLNISADVLIPAAIADAIHEDNADQVQARIVVEGANIATTTAAEELLRERGIPVVPDFVANSAGAGLFGSVLYLGLAPKADEIISFLRTKISESTRTILEMSAAQSISPREAAVKLNDTRLTELQR